MRVSVKARYGLSAMICMSRNDYKGGCVTVVSLADRLGVSKIYLEQVFSLLKRSGLVVATKGAQGGYQLARSPKDITVFQVLSAIESTLFEKTKTTVMQNEKFIEQAMQTMVFDKLDEGVADLLLSITFEDLACEVKRQSADEAYMYFI